MLYPRVMEDRCIFEISGELCGATAIALMEQLRSSLDHTHFREVLIDLSGVEVIDATGIWMLIEAKSLGAGNLHLTGHSAAVLKRLAGAHTPLLNGNSARARA